MAVADRLRHLLEAQGHSLADAQRVTGVSRETIRRMVNGETPPKMIIYLRKIAAGYGLADVELLEGASPKGEFEWNIRHASPEQRLEWLLMSKYRRVKLALDFLRARCPQTIAPRILASALGTTEANLRNMLDRWEVSPPDRRVVEDLAQAIHGLTGISLSWFQWGGLAGTWKEGPGYLTHLSRWVRTPGLVKSLKEQVVVSWG